MNSRALRDLFVSLFMQLLLPVHTISFTTCDSDFDCHEALLNTLTNVYLNGFYNEASKNRTREFRIGLTLVMHH